MITNSSKQRKYNYSRETLKDTNNNDKKNMKLWPSIPGRAFREKKYLYAAKPLDQKYLLYKTAHLRFEQ